MSKTSLLVSILMLVAYSSASAQLTDSEGWFTLGYDHSFNKNWAASIETELRLRNDGKETDQYFLDAGIEYDLNRFVTAGINYRLIQKPDDGDTVSEHRWNGDLSVGIEVRRFELSSRSRYQMRSGEFVFEPNNSDRQTFRNRIQVEYNIRKSAWKPEISAESYWRLADEESFLHKKMRYTAGVDYSTRRDNRISVFVRLEQEYNAKNPDRILILGAGYKVRR